MRTYAELVFVIVGTTLIAIPMIVLFSAATLPITYAADWLLGSKFDLLSHPRRNALILGSAFMIVAYCSTFGKPTQLHHDDQTTPRIGWRVRRRR